MNVARLNFCLSHEDPNIIRKGLNAFTEQILEEHDAGNHFGYNGRGMSLFKESNMIATDNANTDIVMPEKVVGILETYIRSSPKLEQFFIVWELTQVHSEDRDLSTALIQCIAVIIHCTSRSKPSFCTVLTNRILFERHRALQSQLTSGHLSLVHATIGLLISLARSSQSNCRDVYQKFVSQHLSMLSTLSQRGKAVVWPPAAEPSSESNQSSTGKGSSLSTDSRYLLMVLAYAMLRCEDAEVVAGCIATDSLLRKIVHSLHRDTHETAAATLRMLHALLLAPGAPLMQARVPVIDLSVQKVLLDLYTTNNGLILPAHALLTSFVEALSGQPNRSSLNTGNNNSANTSNNNNLNVLEKFVGLLDAASIPKHAELQKLALTRRPELLRVAVGTVSTSWEPEVSHKFVRIIAHLCRLVTALNPLLLTRILQTAKLPRRTPNVERPVSKDSWIAESPQYTSLAVLASEVQISRMAEKESEAAEAAAARAVAEVLAHLFPKALGKKDLSKMLSHSNDYIQRLGLLYVRGVLAMLRKAMMALSPSFRTPVLEAAVSAALAERLPDMVFMLHVRQRYLQQVPQEISSSENDATVSGAKKKQSKDKGKNSSAISPDVERAKYLLSITHDVLGIYADIAPSVVRAGSAEIFKLMVDAMTWDVNVNSQQVLAQLPISTTHIEALQCAIALMHRATELKCFRWFGSSEDLGRNALTLLQTGRWSAGKPTSLARLLLLACCADSQPALGAVSKAAQALLQLVLASSGYFPSILEAESLVWARAARPDGYTVEVLDFLLRAGVHWGTAIAIHSSSATSAIEGMNTSVMLNTAIALSSSAFAACGTASVLHITAKPPSTVTEPLGKALEHVCLQVAQTMVGASFKRYGRILGSLANHWGQSWSPVKNIQEFLAACSGEGHVQLTSTTDVIMSDYITPSGLYRLAENVRKSIVELPNHAVYDCWFLVALLVVQHQPTSAGLQWVAAQARRLIAQSHEHICQQQLLAQQCRHLLLLLAPLLPPRNRGATALTSGETSVVGKKRKAGNSAVLDAKVVRRGRSSSKTSVDDNSAGEDENTHISVRAQACSSEVSTSARETAAVLFGLHAKCEWKLAQASCEIGRTVFSDAVLLTSTSPCDRSQDIAVLSVCAAAGAAAHSTRQTPQYLNSLLQATLPASADIVAAMEAEPALLMLGLLLHNSAAQGDMRSAVSDNSSVRVIEDASAQLLARRGCFSALQHLGADIVRLFRSLSPSIVSNLYKSSPQVATTLLAEFDKSGVMTWMCDPLASLTPDALQALLLPPEILKSDMLHAWDATPLSAARLTSFAARTACRHEFAELWDSSTAKRSSKAVKRAMPEHNPALFLIYLATLPLTVAQDALLTWEGASSVAATAMSVPALHSQASRPLSVCSAQYATVLMQALLAGAAQASVSVHLPTNLISAVLASSVGCSSSDQDGSAFYCSPFVENVLALLAQSAAGVREQAMVGPLPLLVLRGALLFNNASSGGTKAAAQSADKWCALWSALLGTQEEAIIRILSEEDIVDAAAAAQAIAHITLLLELYAEVLQEDTPDSAHELAASLREESVPAVSVVSGVLKLAYAHMDKTTVLHAATALTRALFSSNLMNESSQRRCARTLLLTVTEHPQAITLTARVAVQELILVLANANVPTSEEVATSTGDKIVDEEVTQAMMPLLEAMAVQYRGTLSYSDRLTSRIVTVFSAAKICPTLLSMIKISWETSAAANTNTAKSQKPVLFIQSTHLSATLTRFPHGRTFIPQPFLIEGQAAIHRYLQSTHHVLQEACSGWSQAQVPIELPVDMVRDDVKDDAYEGTDDEASSGSDHDPDATGANDEGDTPAARDVDLSDEESGDSASEISDTGGADFVEEEEADTLRDQHASLEAVGLDTYGEDSGLALVYDPAFWLPALHVAITIAEPSVRRLANTGVLAVNLAALCCTCPMLRSCAMANLARVTELAQKQTPKVDISFRERPQVLQLLVFARNSLVAPSVNALPLTSGTASSNIPSMPFMSACFLARASQIVMQVGHELYAFIGRYLLSRPFCDHKDIPLYDMLVNGGAGEGRLTALRSLRDGLVSRIDHLCLCRKNAYQRLLVSFVPLGHGDPRMGHVLLDILERALVLPQGSRYLLQRSGLLLWLRQMASALAARGSSDAGPNPGAEMGVIPNSHGSRISTSPKLQPRILQLLRRSIASILLLQDRMDITGLVVEVSSCVVMLVTDIALAGCGTSAANSAARPSRESLRQLVLLMWDVSVLCAVCPQRASLPALWDASLLKLVTDAVKTSAVLSAEATELQVTVALLPGVAGCYGDAKVGQDTAATFQAAEGLLDILTRGSPSSAMTVLRVQGEVQPSAIRDSATNANTLSRSMLHLSESEVYSCIGVKVLQKEQEILHVLTSDHVLAARTFSEDRKWQQLTEVDPVATALPGAAAACDQHAYGIFLRCRAVCALVHTLQRAAPGQSSCMPYARWALAAHARLLGNSSQHIASDTASVSALRQLCTAAAGCPIMLTSPQIVQCCRSSLALLAGSAIRGELNEVSEHGPLEDAVSELGATSGAIELQGPTANSVTELAEAVLALASRLVTQADAMPLQSRIVPALAKNPAWQELVPLLMTVKSIHSGDKFSDISKSQPAELNMGAEWTVSEQEVRTRGFLYDTAPWRRGRLIVAAKVSKSKVDK